MFNDPDFKPYVMMEVEFPAGDVILEEGEQADTAYLILEGKVKVSKKTPQGRAELDTLKEGSIFGELNLFFQQSLVRTARVTADGPVTLGVLDAETIRREYQETPEEVRILMKGIIVSLIRSSKVLARTPGVPT